MATAKKASNRKLKKKTTVKKKVAAKKKLTAIKKEKSVLAPKRSAKLARIGQPIPDLTLVGTTGGEVKLSDLKGKKVVLYFYPKDATPGCTIEGKDFSRLLNEFKDINAEVFGISRDSLASHEKFRSKENYSVHLLSDEEEQACQQFDVIKMKNMYGKQVRGIERSTFVIDQDGKLVKEWRKVNVTGHADEVLQFVKLL